MGATLPAPSANKCFSPATKSNGVSGPCLRRGLVICFRVPAWCVPLPNEAPASDLPHDVLQLICVPRGRFGLVSRWDGWNRQSAAGPGHLFLNKSMAFFIDLITDRPNVRKKPTATVMRVPSGRNVSGPTYANSGSFMPGSMRIGPDSSEAGGHTFDCSSCEGCVQPTPRNPVQDGGSHPPYRRPAGPLHSNNVERYYRRLNQAAFRPLRSANNCRPPGTTIVSKLVGSKCVVEVGCGDRIPCRGADRIFHEAD